MFWFCPHKMMPGMSGLVKGDVKSIYMMLTFFVDQTKNRNI
ncbi:MAG: hypothetical protein RLZZ507_486 [Cyanobacteriota bacterium]|jgi:hypothetical protein